MASAPGDFKNDYPERAHGDCFYHFRLVERGQPVAFAELGPDRQPLAGVAGQHREPCAVVADQQALLLDVRVLVADEIISMLDASTRVDVLNLLVTLKRAGLAIVFITHDLSLGNYVSDRTIILRHGAIMELGPTELVFGNPQHDYTRMLLTAVPELRKKWEHAALGPVAVSNGTSPTSPGLEPPALHEFEPGHLVAEAE